MERRQLESAAANYPYLQGLWTIPLGIGIIVAGISNLQNRRPGSGRSPSSSAAWRSPGQSP